MENQGRRSWPLWTAAWPGVGGRIRERLEDFEVEEVAAYEPCGQGEHLFLWVEKRGVGSEYLLRAVAQCLGIPVGAVGAAGLKDRYAITRQWLSVPQECAERLGRLEALHAEGIYLLRVARHRNKLKPGHLRGNRFCIFIRGASAAAPWQAILEKIRREGLPNYYGPQRFGREGSTLALGWQCLRGQLRRRLRPFQFRLALSAVQSHLFNDYLARRQEDGLLHTALEGDVMAHWPVGGLFRVEDVAAEQRRLEAREIVPAGPMFGTRTYPAAGVAARREADVLRSYDLTPAVFAGFGQLLSGTRRHNLIYLDDLQAEWEAEGLRLRFTLPAGSYATVLLREVMKNDAVEAVPPDEAEEE
ncbi:tRNA pseudouridine(13) synthase TruD [Thermogemmata fonticola]|uniref:tRNA pseudouridine synthase D n=1 Tax=Thermogemmata fonticola TaxID=2755323 RepID=A0A7V9ACM0_9BACT|nr:tRNA pseudouridine(13) synthase TruD [Thermogemmata fonticola]MBA2227169.1 tRNA pseudouridine(13) synthase TruD [Thermogemmata fonticola]